MVFYRKYRPQTLNELVGQTAVKKELQTAFLAGKLSHAYLFCGPRGVGKTSTARILAKMVNCESEKLENSPCNKCPSCVSITDGSSLDVIEMDAASNRGIEDIRALRENIKLAPTSAHKKVYIIDEVHMLSTDAFNALLKTLEEPPSHVLFILATTEIQKIPATVLSRATKMEFKPASDAELVEVLECIAKKEKLEVDEEALQTLARMAGGSVRDAQKLLDQLSTHKKIDREVVEESLGVGNLELSLKLLESIARGSMPESLKLLQKQLEEGFNPKELNFFLLDILRQVLFIKNGVGEGNRLLQDLAGNLEIDRLLLIMDSLQKSLEQARFISIPTLPLEMAVAESCGISKSAEADNTDSTDAPTSEPVDNPTRQSADLADNLTPDIQKIQERWMYILETVRQYNYSLEALLRSAKILGCNGSSVTLEVPYSFHQRILEAPKSRDLLQSILSDILGRSIGISTVLGSRQVKREEIANVEVAADDEVVRIAAEIFNSEPVN